jgi:class 3 adenylate cyclase/pimeloyl-ACP methyl ester carboxylesterase
LYAPVFGGRIAGVPSRPVTEYAHVGDASVAYQVVGEGPVDLIYVRGPTSQVELPWEEPQTAVGLRRLASFARLVLFDRRGTGLSDPLERPPTLEEQMEDLRAVMDAVGLTRTALLGGHDVGLCALFAATYPDDVTALVLSGATPAGPSWPEEAREAVLDAIEHGWGQGRTLPVIAPSKVGDAAFEEFWARYERAGTSPGMARRLVDLRARSDFRAILPSVRVPTMVMNRTGDAVSPPAAGREVAALIPGARFVELPGGDIWPFAGEMDAWIDEVQEFLTGERHPESSDRVLATVLFTDIVGSTELAARLDDRRWRELLDEHNTLMRKELVRWRGIELNTTGDGFLARFDGPARAIRCAAAVAQAVAPLDIELRAGVHTGECERQGENLAGLAVHIGARIAALAEPGEVLVSGTVKDLVVGSGLQFRDRGAHALKGVPDRWHLYALAADQPNRY